METSFSAFSKAKEKAPYIIDFLRRQNISPKNYSWYIGLRTMPNYKTTSGFGLGIERFIAWVLGLNDIKYATIYPRLKNIKITP